MSVTQNGLVTILPLPQPTGSCPAHYRQPPISHISLPDDILLEVVPYLDFMDALSLSLVSKHIHSIAPPRISAIRCKYKYQVADLHNFMIGNMVDPSRILQLRSLELDRFALMDFIKNPVNSSVPPRIHVTRMFLEVAFNAKNLRRLVLGDPGCYDDWLSPLKDMPSLVYLRLATIPNNAILQVLTYPPNLRILHIHYHWVHLRYKMLFPDVVLLLSSQFPRLETLILEDCEFSGYIDGDTHIPFPSHPSVRDVVFRNVLISDDTVISHFKRAFPYARSLHLSGCIVRLKFSSVADRNTLAPPHLHLLMAANITKDDFMSWKVDRLVLFDYDDRAVCDGSSVVCLTLRTQVLKPYIWDEVARAFPKVSLIEFECTREMDNVSILAQFTEALERAQDRPFCEELLCLSILASFSSNEKERLRRDLLLTFSRYLPKLRYFAIAELSPGFRPDMQDLREDCASDRVPWQWWKIIRRDDVGSPMEIVEIPAWEGERVRAYLRDADVEGAAKFDDRFVALR